MRISDWSSDVCSSDLIEDIEFQFEIKRTRAETDKAAADERAAIGFDNFLKHCGNACGVVGIGLIDDAKREFHPPMVKVHKIGRAHVCTPVTNAHIVCRLLLEKKKNSDHITIITCSTANLTNQAHLT